MNHIPDQRPAPYPIHADQRLADEGDGGEHGGVDERDGPPPAAGLRAFLDFLRVFGDEVEVDSRPGEVEDDHDGQEDALDLEEVHFR